MKKLLFFLALSFPLLGYAQTTALPLPIDMHYVYLTLNGQNCNYGVDLVEFPGQQGLPGVTYYEEQFNSMYCPLNESYCDPNYAQLSMSQVGNKWFKGDYLWFDWDNQVGDFCQLDFPGNLLIDCVVSSIDTLIFADGVPRRQYHLESIEGYSLSQYGLTFTFIEGIGTNILGIENQGVESQQFLSCVFDKNGLQIIQNDFFPNMLGCCNPISVEENATSSFKLFPSPATSQTSLQFESAHIPQSIQIFNATGQLMHTEKVLGRMQIQMNVSEYANGIYTIRARFENGEEVSEKLVVE